MILPSATQPSPLPASSSLSTTPAMPISRPPTSSSVPSSSSSSLSSSSSSSSRLFSSLPIPTFLTPLLTAPCRSSSSWLSAHSTTSLPRQHHAFCAVRLVARPRRPRSQLPCPGPAIAAVQARPVSGDSDGEVSENVIATPQKSFSVGLTIVSGFDSALRRSVIERIVSGADTGRIVVVTTGGITSTDETDGLTSSSSTTTSTTSQPSSTIESPSDPSTAAAATPSSTSPPASSSTSNSTSNSTSASANLSSSTSPASAPIPATTQANGTPQPQSPNAYRNNSQNLNSSNTAIESSQQLNENQTSPTSDQPTDPLSADKATPQSLSTVQNLEGWISCNSSEEMVEVVLKLAASRECDYIIAESAIDANMEPQHFAQTLHHRGGASLRVDTLVSVLDGGTLLDDLLASPLSTSPPPTPPPAQTTGLDSSDANSASPAASGDTADDPTASGSAGLPDGITNESQALSSSSSSSSTPSPIHDESSQQRPMILVSLVEHANVVVVAQQPDDRSLEQLSRVQEIVSVLNGNASIVPTIMTANSSSSSTSADENTLAVDLLINTNLYNNEDVEYSPTWKRVLRAARMGPPIGTASLTGNKISGAGVGGVVGAPNGSNNSTPRMSLPRYVKEATFLYKAKRPFHPSRLYEHIKDVATFTGVIRSTGRIWLATRMLAPLEWNQAGVAATLRMGKPFWAATPETDWPKSEEERDRIMIDWDNRYGDRETEIVFVGIGIDKSRLQGLLDGCLLQDEEMVFNNLWENFEDPFVEWVPLIEDDDEEEALMDLPIATVEPAPTSNVQVQEKEQVTPIDTVNQEEQEEEKEQVNSRVGDDDAVADETLLPFDPDDVQQDEQGIDIKQFVDNDAGFEQVETIEGQIDDSELPDDVFNSVSVLELFADGLDMKEGNDLGDGTDRRDAGTPTPLIAETEDDGAYEEDDVMIASWDGAMADGILMKIPRVGVPITLLTGFLGSGKTTVLNHILTADHGLRIAVLVNEFGEIDIDSKLVENNNKNGSFTWDTGDIMELTNGCICCDINDSFLSAVERILDQRRDAVDYIIVETTGVADPVPVINSLMDTEIANEIRLDGVLTLVDALNFDLETHMGSEAALSQIMAADTILLSKTDVADKAKVEKVVEFIRRYRPAARILRSQRGRVPLDLILDVGLRIADSPAHLDPSKSSTSTATNDANHDHHHENEHDHDHDHDHKSESGYTHDHHGHDHDHKTESSCSHDHDHDHDHHNHNHSHSHNHLEADGFMTTSFKSDRPLDAQLFMDRFLRLLPEGVYRAKGLLYFRGFSERYVFQLSGRRYHMQMDDWPEGDAPGNQLVVIGKDLNLKDLRDTLENCHADTLVDDETAAPDVDADVDAAYALSDDDDDAGADAENGDDHFPSASSPL